MSFERFNGAPSRIHEHDYKYLFVKLESGNRRKEEICAVDERKTGI
jgi:hypothetical protein